MAAAELLLPVYFFFVRAAYHCRLVTCVTINYAQLLYAHVARSIARITRPASYGGRARFGLDGLCQLTDYDK